MTDKEIRQQIERATAEVQTWPSWKRNILVHSSQPTNSTARTPVDNRQSSSSQSEPQSPASEGQ
ncbi:hypothetical protein [Allorhodopirellula heiligendammensis]|uniref:Uncharacterized protein n=1 Tax=Allorhodopirellula heiligendammensis TaxID=2714739 RepID=A0A5C6BV98_9BACT|nr:hypothetical protein [Allorhodopirellula heiligendammensis]TWU15782.1 hypothetical protein Poly21_29840 [Allorhodopirellula heiligendammensis]